MNRLPRNQQPDDKQAPQNGKTGKATPPPKRKTNPVSRRGRSDFDANYPDGAAPSSGGPKQRIPTDADKP